MLLYVCVKYIYSLLGIFYKSTVSGMFQIHSTVRWVRIYEGPAEYDDEIIRRKNKK